VTSKDGTPIAFETTGEGPPLLIVGGALSDRHAAATQAGLLAPNFRVYTYDRRGRGDSGDTPPYAVEREIEDTQALVEGAGGTAFALGHSSGAVLALEAAVSTPGILKLVLYEPPFIIDHTRPPVPDDYLERLTELTSAGRGGDAIEYFLIAGAGLLPEAVAPMKDSSSWPAIETLAHTLPYDGAVMGPTLSGKQLPADRWATVTIPTLVVDGGESPAWQRNAAQALVDVLPNARRLTLEGQTHNVDPRVLTPVLEEFLTGAEPPRTGGRPVSADPAPAPP
jgi:pimeloyl-ACP methyl ester carboxylesterase